MLKIVCILLLSMTGCVACSGCLAEVKVRRSLDGTVEASYKRWGNQEIGTFSLNLDGTVTFTKQKSDNTAMYETFNKLIDRIP